MKALRSARFVSFLGWACVVVGALLAAGPGGASDVSALPWLRAGLLVVIAGMGLVFSGEQMSRNQRDRSGEPDR